MPFRNDRSICTRSSSRALLQESVAIQFKRSSSRGLSTGSKPSFDIYRNVLICRIVKSWIPRINRGMTPVTELPRRSYALRAMTPVCYSIMRGTITAILLIALSLPNGLLAFETADTDHDNDAPPLTHIRKTATGPEESEPPPPSSRSPGALEQGEEERALRRVVRAEKLCSIVTNTIMAFFALGAVPYFLYLISTAPSCSAQSPFSDMTLPNSMNITSTP